MLSKKFLTNCFKLITSSTNALSPHNSSVIQQNSIRSYATKKRFYKRTGILQNNKNYEITLDQRKLKTPKGNLFTVESEPLAIAIAAEWDAQKENINQASMHLSTLCNTAIDNPNNLTKLDLVNYITTYLDTDTILFQSGEDDELYKFQMEEWDPVIQWFCDRFQVTIQKSRDISGPNVPLATKMNIGRYLTSHNFAALNGFVYGVDTVKSPMLTIATAERFITPEKAVLLSRLEEEYQLGHWGRVEWAHDLNQQDLQARLSATMLFIYFNTCSTSVQSKIPIK